MIAGVWKAMYMGFETSTGYENLDALVNRGGMGSMLEVIWADFIGFDVWRCYGRNRNVEKISRTIT